MSNLADRFTAEILAARAAGRFVSAVIRDTDDRVPAVAVHCPVCDTVLAGKVAGTAALTLACHNHRCSEFQQRRRFRVLIDNSPPVS